MAGNENKWSCRFPEKCEVSIWAGWDFRGEAITSRTSHTQNIIMVNPASPPHAGACTLRAILFGKFIWQWVSSLLLWIAIMSGETSLNLAISIARQHNETGGVSHKQKTFPSDGHRELKCIFGIFWSLLMAQSTRRAHKSHAGCRNYTLQLIEFTSHKNVTSAQSWVW